MASSENTRSLKKTNWKNTDKRFVAFFDLLGFKDKIMRNSHNEIFEQLNKLSSMRNRIENSANSESIKRIFVDVDIYTVSFSDSIALFSKNDSFQNFEFFIAMVRYFISNAIKNNVAIKGGIAFGDISLNKTEQIYFGQPIIDAYYIEEDVNFLGVVLHNSVDKYIRAHENECSKSGIISKSIINERTPLKTGKIYHNSIDYFKMLSDSEISDKDNITIDILKTFRRFYESVSGSPRRYIDNTIDFYDTCLSNKKVNFDKLKPL